MEVSDFMDRLGKLEKWQSNYIILSVVSHIDAERKHGYEFGQRTWNELERDLEKMEEWK